MATNQKRASLIAEDLISTYKNQNTIVEKSFRFLKDSKFFADAMFLHKPERIEAMLMIMSLSLLFYSATEYMFQKKLKESEETLPNQKSALKVLGIESSLIQTFLLRSVILWLDVSHQTYNL